MKLNCSVGKWSAAILLCVFITRPAFAQYCPANSVSSGDAFEAYDALVIAGDVALVQAVLGGGDPVEQARRDAVADFERGALVYWKEVPARGGPGTYRSTLCWTRRLRTETKETLDLDLQFVTDMDGQCCIPPCPPASRRTLYMHTYNEIALALLGEGEASAEAEAMAEEYGLGKAHAWREHTLKLLFEQQRDARQDCNCD